MRLGYGPPDGDKLDRRGWRSYFDRMNDLKLYDMILNVFADDLPKEWSPHQVRPEWLEGLDKDVTSRSRAFAFYPPFQLMWQKGYGPKNGDELDIEGWEKFQAEMPEDERKKMYNELFVITEDPVHDAEIREKYRNHVRESQGFDVEVQVKGGCGTITPMFYDMSQAKYDDTLIQYSTKALVEYNELEGTDYNGIEVVKACSQVVAGVMYFITFQARNSEGCIQDFQAKVHETLKSEVKIVLVRTKPGKA